MPKCGWSPLKSIQEFHAGGDCLPCLQGLEREEDYWLRDDRAVKSGAQAADEVMSASAASLEKQKVLDAGKNNGEEETRAAHEEGSHGGTKPRKKKKKKG